MVCGSRMVYDPCLWTSGTLTSDHSFWYLYIINVCLCVHVMLYVLLTIVFFISSYFPDLSTSPLNKTFCISSVGLFHRCLVSDLPLSFGV